MQQSARFPGLEGAGVFISGGATGIGADLVRGFRDAGAQVVFGDIDAGSGAALAEATGALFRPCDVTDLEALQATIASVEERAPLKVVVNNAANDRRAPLGDISPADWTVMMDVNLRHHLFAAQTAAPLMAGRGGVILNIGSIAPEIAINELSVYSTAKAATRGMTRSLARELGGQGIRVNAILPGAVLTPRQRELWYPDQASIDKLLSQQMIAREVEGTDIANMALFLASDLGAACTGQNYVVDAGMM